MKSRWSLTLFSIVFCLKKKRNCKRSVTRVQYKQNNYLYQNNILLFRHHPQSWMWIKQWQQLQGWNRKNNNNNDNRRVKSGGYGIKHKLRKSTLLCIRPHNPNLIQVFWRKQENMMLRIKKSDCIHLDLNTSVLTWSALCGRFSVPLSASNNICQVITFLPNHRLFS